MDWTTPILWGQVGASTNPAAAAYLTARRWCGGLTLTAPDPAPGLEAFWMFAAALCGLLTIGLAAQGAGPFLRQLVDLPGHLRLARAAAARVGRSGRLVLAAIVFTVLSWTGAQTLAFFFESPERGRSDLTLLTRAGAGAALAAGQGAPAALSPLRDLAGLADNLPALVAAAVLAFRFASSAGPTTTFDPKAPQGTPPRYAVREPSRIDGWATAVWACAGLYAIYRMVGRAAGSPDLPLGGCLVVEALLVPAAMLVCDGFLLAWALVELRDAGADVRADARSDAAEALRLMPAAAVGCLLALPARYAATAVFLGSQHLPPKALSGWAGGFVRWQLGWGLLELQAAGLVALGALGAAAWTEGAAADLGRGLRRILAGRGARLLVVTAAAGLASAAASASAYYVVLLLPSAGWVLRAADGYAHYATAPVGLWTLAALATLAEETLPLATAAPDAAPAPDFDAEPPADA